MFNSRVIMKPNFLSVDGAYACFYFDKEFRTVIVPVNELKYFNKYSDEFEKVFGYCPEKINNYSWARIISNLKRNSTATK